MNFEDLSKKKISSRMSFKKTTHYSKLMHIKMNVQNTVFLSKIRCIPQEIEQIKNYHSQIL